MCQICNEPISGWELLGRNLTETSNITKAGVIKNDKAIYPRITKEDNERPGYFSNKISMVRLCRCLDEEGINFTKHAQIASSFQTPTQNFRGYLVSQASYIKTLGLELTPAASARNPFHAHIVIPEYKEPFREVEMISDVLPQRWIDALDELRNNMRVVIVNPSSKYPEAWQKPSPNPCDGCRHYHN